MGELPTFQQNMRQQNRANINVLFKKQKTQRNYESFGGENFRGVGYYCILLSCV